MKRNQKIAALTVYSAFIGLGISYGPVYLFHPIALLFAFVFVYEMFFSSSAVSLVQIVKGLSKPKLQNFFVIMWVWYALALFWSVDISLALYHLFYISNGIFIVIAMQYAMKSQGDQKQVVRVLGILVFVEIVLSLFEGFSGIQWPISPYSEYIEFFQRKTGYAPELSDDIVNAIRHTPTGFRWNPNNLALTMLIVLPFFVFYRRIAIRIAGSLAALAVIFMTGSRGVLIGLFFMAIAFVFLYLKRKHVLLVLAGIVVSLLMVWFSLPTLQKNYSVKYVEVTNTADAFNKYLFTDHELVNDTSSIAIRQNLAKNGIEALKESYGLGVGGGNSQIVQKDAGNTHGILSMHNFWIEILVEAGLLFFVAWCIWYFLLFRRLYFISKKSHSVNIQYHAKAGSLSLIGFSVGMISISSAIYFFPMWILFGFAIVTIQGAEKV
ncbi:MAG: hypothetical protein CVU11_14625 [Bacteroidetes bacterium HGW-Bacteroidetes-6]|jgi:teichuronic acid biosynthesis protein TuaE|nr:MAG: hypothetical protein CVU11_14625 [Bacteroidetes bacterium HGW-Bacteroidetes-6]